MVAHLTRKTGSPPEQANQTQSAATTQPKKAQVPGPKPKKGESGVALQLQPEVLQSSSQADRAAATRGCTVPPDHHSGEWWAAGGAVRGDFSSPWALDVPQHPGFIPMGIILCVYINTLGI